MSGPLVQSFNVLTTLTTQRLVAQDTSAAHTVVYPPSNQRMPLGVTIDDVKAITQGIPVQLNGKAKLYFNDTVASGSLVAADTSGRGVPFTLPNTTTSVTLAAAYAGVLCDASVAATGTIAQIIIAPGFVRVSA